MGQHYLYDVLIIGSGAAGLTAALHLAPQARVAVLSKNHLNTGSTFYAQGGIAAVLDDTDSVEAHVKDTLEAGAGLCHEDIVRFTVEHSRQSIQWLIDEGVPFTKTHDDKNHAEFHLTQEGGHSHRRIIHAADATGQAVSTTLIEQAQLHPNIDLFEQHAAIDLITQQKLGLAGNHCVGAYVLNNKTGHVDVFRAHFVILATGGASKAYLYTTNPDGASGDGIAIAWRAGCRVANMEFNQFHPTCLYHPQAKSFLITEALRGEGARLRLPSGDFFMDRFHESAELAPRDIVARAIDHEMKRLGCDHVYLDISHKPADFITTHFPTVYARCLEFGIDITKEPIPVVPAAHYTCGGIMINQQGQTDVPHLYAIGETTFSGLHGANRMASNSLLECLVFAQSASHDILNRLKHKTDLPLIPDWDESQVTDSDEDVVISHNWDEVRRFMWDYVGIVRTNKRLQRAKSRIDLLITEINAYYKNYRISTDLLELRNLALVSALIIQSALMRKESRGLHFTLDYPDLGPEAKDTIIAPTNYLWEKPW